MIFTENIIKNTNLEITSGVPDEEALKLISQYTKTDIQKENIYVFKVKLCDNEVDRDFEAFSLDALKSLEALMLGRTGICDHNPTAENQLSRLYDCKLITEERKTQTGENYTYLMGFAYMPRTEATKDFIAAIDAGIHKETSIGCLAKHRICSICGKDARICSHRKGEYYEGKLCYTVLDGVTDAYEWSFVAVPAQREAGVMKHFEPSNEVVKSIAHGCFKAESQSITLSREDALFLSSQIEKLKKAELSYKTDLENEVVRLSVMANPALSFKAMSSLTQKMELEALKELKAELLKSCKQKASPQILSRTPDENSENQYKI